MPAFKMQESFNTLIDSFVDSKTGIAENFLTANLAERLRENIKQLLLSGKMHAAGTGNAAAAVVDKKKRGDNIFWMDRSHNDAAENDFFDLMDAFVLHLNNTCYTGISDYEFHYTLYEAGSFYKKHLDQFRNNESRKYSMIIYLNERWQQGDGGELRIYRDSETETQDISPVNGKAVFFKSSEVEHEVLPALKPRMSITGWLKTDSL